MNKSAYFEVKNEKTIEEFIKSNSFATLVSTDKEYPIATHIPLELEIKPDGKKVLSGHVSKGNSQWKLFETSPKVLAVFFSSVHHYISSSWYAQPSAPTWNYMSVHVYGKTRILDEKESWEIVKNLTDKYEKNSTHPVSLETLPDHVKKQMNGLVAFEIEIEKWEGIFKLSQNKSGEDYENVITELKNLNTPESIAMAKIMEEIKTI